MQEPVHQKHTFFQRPDRVVDPLHVILPVSNSARYRSRWKLYEDAVKRCEEAGAIPWTVEVAFGERDHAVTSADNNQHVQLRTKSELWFKENAVNVAVTRLPSDWKYVAYIDADSQPLRDDWANETVQQLQHYDAVQMWSEYHCLDVEHRIISVNVSMMYAYMNGWTKGQSLKGFAHYPYPVPSKPTWPGSPGLAWAWRRSAWEEVGGLLDVCILGSADTHMAFGLLGRLDNHVVSKAFSPAYRKALFDWQDRASALNRNIGMVNGAWVHHWHGPMNKRGYDTRNKILIDTQYDPTRHLKRDWQGLYQLQPHAPHAIELRDGIRRYLASRNEDHLA